ncbi:hypothetical protein GP486_007189 [Trichoglossum hirsutum]|uniref:Uncharacterized protein n=1 Tax=Trichoglossum hirsutum TaxID=265104 RepID=A0A9P8L2Z4_9PEZI|nr:hypothetical protein GP486_007189 [Trichoglossum hirsutum]
MGTDRRCRAWAIRLVFSIKEHSIYTFQATRTCIRNIVDHSYMEHLDAIAKRLSAEADSADAEVDELLAKLTTTHAHTRRLRKQIAHATLNADKIMYNEMEQIDAEELPADNSGPSAVSIDQAVATSLVASLLALDFNVEDLLRTLQGFSYSLAS